MTSIVSIITVFMATFMLVFGYLSYTEEDTASVAADGPTASVAQTDR